MDALDVYKEAPRRGLSLVRLGSGDSLRDLVPTQRAGEGGDEPRAQPRDESSDGLLERSDLDLRGVLANGAEHRLGYVLWGASAATPEAA